jgi:hypothetical protein
MADGDDYIPAINRLVIDIDKRDAETSEMKRTVNRLCGYANLPVRYPNIDDSAGTARGFRINPGQFYRKPLATAVTAFLRMRGDPATGGSGPATIDEIYAALLEGGFTFDAQNDAFAKRSLAIALAKNSQTFEKLPTGQFGMRSWYRGGGEE